MDQPLKTLKQAKRYADKIELATGNKHIIFKVPNGSPAYMLGYRFGTCLAKERRDYELDGAVFVDEK